MGAFIEALITENRRTENGLLTNSTSLNKCVDLFFQIGAMRGQDKDRLISLFSSAYCEDALTATKILFWVRDVRGGAGERQIFRDILKYLAENHKETLIKNIDLIPTFGRWDDVFGLISTSVNDEAINLVVKSLESGDSLCAKWSKRKGPQANAIRKALGVTPKEYRKLIVSLTNVVETKMCKKEWDIDFGKVPSVAMARYAKAFRKNNEDGFQTYLESVNKGEAKINTGAVYPYDLIKTIKYGDRNTAQIQWDALPNFLEGNTKGILPIVDVSGSMSCPAGNNPNLTCMDVALSLGLYISERNLGAFENAFITFSSKPTLEVLNGGLVDRLLQMERSNWCMNTNLIASFELILEQAKRFKLPQSEMPGTLLILSDMEFDEANKSPTISWGDRYEQFTAYDLTAQQNIKKMYEDAGYSVPEIVYWNIQSRRGQAPVRFDETGTTLISGFSPAILKSILGGDEISPVSVMNKTINSERYNQITI